MALQATINLSSIINAGVFLDYNQGMLNMLFYRHGPQICLTGQVVLNAFAHTEGLPDRHNLDRLDSNQVQDLVHHTCPRARQAHSMPCLPFAFFILLLLHGEGM